MSTARQDYITSRIVESVRARFASFLQQAKDEHFLPPKTIVNGVDIGEIDAKALQIWSMVVRERGRKLAAARQTGSLNLSTTC